MFTWSWACGLSLSLSLSLKFGQEKKKDEEREKSHLFGRETWPASPETRDSEMRGTWEAEGSRRRADLPIRRAKPSSKRRRSSPTAGSRS
ncbi:unnamed protein product [Musa hybrid cultivar]